MDLLYFLAASPTVPKGALQMETAPPEASSLPQSTSLPEIQRLQLVLICKGVFLAHVPFPASMALL